MLSREAFIETVEHFLAQSGMAPTAFGREAIGDPNLAQDLREGRSVGLRTAERIATFIETKSAPSPEQQGAA